MPRIVLTGTEIGVRKVSLSKILKARAGFTLAQAKSVVDKILEEQPVSIDVADFPMAEALVRDLRSLGAVCHIEEPPT